MRQVSDRFSALLDANVLYPFLIRDVLLSLAEGGLYRPLWTADIHEEWTRHLIGKRPEHKDRIKTTVSVMNEAFPEAIVDDYQDLISTVILPDPDDRHVVAAAIRGGANVIVTENIADFPTGVLDRYDLEVRTADEFILNTVELYLTDALAALRTMRHRYANPPLSAEELLQAMLRCGLVTTVAALAPHVASL